MRVRCLVCVESFDCYKDELEVSSLSWLPEERYRCRLSELPEHLVRNVRRGDALIAAMIFEEGERRSMCLAEWELAPDPVAEDLL